MEDYKFIIHASTHEELMFGAECCFDMLKNEHKLCGYGLNGFFASARKSKSGVVVKVSKHD